MPQTSRRKFAALLASPALVPAAASAQAPATPAPAAGEDVDALARNQIQSNSTRLKNVKLDMSVEPAFAFKP